MTADAAVVVTRSDDAGHLDAGRDATSDASPDRFVAPVPDAFVAPLDAGHDSGPAVITSLSAGTGFACATLSNGAAYCWGSNLTGELGNGTTTDSTTPIQVTGIGAAKAISAGFTEACAVLTAGTAACWGGNESGDLGNGTTVDSYVPVPVTGLTGVTAIAVGGNLGADGQNVVCAIAAQQEAYCWGLNPYGGVGPRPSIQEEVPTLNPGLIGITAIAANQDDVCAVSNGILECLGAGSSGQIGDGLSLSSPIPTSVNGLQTTTALTVGLNYACAVLVGGNAYCWGTNAQGQLGDGTNVASSSPVQVSLPVAATAISAGTSQTCALLEDSSVVCWGENNYGQLGVGSSGFTSSTPVAVKGLTGVIAITSGDAFNCALLKGGTAVCWGRNDSGQLGNGTLEGSNVPVPVTITW